MLGPMNGNLSCMQQLSAEISQVTKALDVFLARVSDDFIQRLIADPVLEELSFSIEPI